VGGMYGSILAFSKDGDVEDVTEYTEGCYKENEKWSSIFKHFLDNINSFLIGLVRADSILLWQSHWRQTDFLICKAKTKSPHHLSSKDIISLQQGKVNPAICDLLITALPASMSTRIFG
jgi:hypothetical protein